MGASRGAARRLARAAVMEGPGRITVRQLPVPSAPPDGGAIVRVLANGICGSDWDLYAGVLTQIRGRPVPFPIVLGHEPVGEVVAIDPAAAAHWGVATGDRVVIGSTVRCGRCAGCAGGEPGVCANGVTYSMLSVDVGAGLWGGMAEYMVLLPGSQVVPVPEHLSDADAALFNPLGNAIHWTIERAEVGVGDDVLVLGAGQRGLCCVVAAREAGARRIVVTGLATDAHKLALAASLGATATVVVDEQDTVATVLELTDGRGVDAVVDTVPGATQPIRDAIGALRPRGTLVVAGLRTAEMDKFPLESFRAKQLRMLGASATTPRAVRLAVEVLARRTALLGQLHTHEFGLDEAERAIRLLGGCEPTERPIHVVVKP